jgi:hypothetical protein
VHLYDYLLVAALSVWMIGRSQHQRWPAWNRYIPGSTGLDWLDAIVFGAIFLIWFAA